MTSDYLSLQYFFMVKAGISHIACWFWVHKHAQNELKKTKETAGWEESDNWLILG